MTQRDLKNTIAATLASLVQARINCTRSNNTEWFGKHSDRIDEIAKNLLPSGSGIDSGTAVDLDRSTGDKLVLTTAFHHMNDGGMYDGWTEHTVIVTPTFDGIDCRITGRDRNGIKEYLSGVFNTCLMEDVQ
jgi:hypothetical protein